MPLPKRLAFALLIAVALAPKALFAQLAIPYQATNVPLVDLVDVAVYELDLATLPARPRFTATATAGASHPDLELEIELTQCTLVEVFGAPTAPTSIGPVIGIGAAGVSYDVQRHAPFGTASATCDVEVRALDFGIAGPPATFDLSVTAETVVPTGTDELEIDPVPQPTSTDVPGFRDTTIYAEGGSTSNGLGEEIWVGEYRNFGGFPPVFDIEERRGLIAFEITEYVPAGSTIDDVEIELFVTQAFLGGTLPNVSIQALEPDPAPGLGGFYSGDGVAALGSLLPPTSTVQSSTWTHRSYPFGAWTAGGPTVGGVLATTILGFYPGPMSFQTAALTAEVADQFDAGGDRDGFRLSAGNLNPIGFSPQAIALRSIEGGAAAGSGAPVMHVDYTPALPAPVDGTAPLGTYSFIGETQNFRWLYDADDDGVYTTSIGGICSFDDDPTGQTSLPYSYAFTGAPTTTAIDCCTWSVTTNTSVDGVGQAVFYIGLDPNDPANTPSDFDGDGIFDLCDSCPYTANGPLAGSCLGGPTPMVACVSDLDCGAGGTCEMFQTDSDGAVPGDACAVPEPGLAIGLAVGIAGLASTARSRRGRPGRRGSPDRG